MHTTSESEKWECECENEREKEKRETLDWTAFGLMWAVLLRFPSHAIRWYCTVLYCIVPVQPYSRPYIQDTTYIHAQASSQKLFLSSNEKEQRSSFSIIPVFQLFLSSVSPRGRRGGFAVLIGQLLGALIVSGPTAAGLQPQIHVEGQIVTAINKRW